MMTHPQFPYGLPPVTAREAAEYEQLKAAQRAEFDLDEARAETDAHEEGR